MSKRSANMAIEGDSQPNKRSSSNRESPSEMATNYDGYHLAYNNACSALSHLLGIPLLQQFHADFFDIKDMPSCFKRIKIFNTNENSNSYNDILESCFNAWGKDSKEPSLTKSIAKKIKENLKEYESVSELRVGTEQMRINDITVFHVRVISTKRCQTERKDPAKTKETCYCQW